MRSEDFTLGWFWVNHDQAEVFKFFSKELFAKIRPGFVDLNVEKN